MKREQPNPSLEPTPTGWPRSGVLGFSPARGQGVSMGTGFFFAFAMDGDKSVPAIVTNRHVVKCASTGRFHPTTRGADGGPQIGSTVTVVLDNFEGRPSGPG
jgi:hypothetical protein